MVYEIRTIGETNNNVKVDGDIIQFFDGCEVEWISELFGRMVITLKNNFSLKFNINKRGEKEIEVYKENES